MYFYFYHNKYIATYKYFHIWRVARIIVLVFWRRGTQYARCFSDLYGRWMMIMILTIFVRNQKHIRAYMNRVIFVKCITILYKIFINTWRQKKKKKKKPQRKRILNNMGIQKSRFRCCPILSDLQIFYPTKRISSTQNELRPSPTNTWHCLPKADRMIAIESFKAGQSVVFTSNVFQCSVPWLN